MKGAALLLTAVGSILAQGIGPGPGMSHRPWVKVYSIAIDRTKCGLSSQSSFPVLVHASDPSLKSAANGGSVAHSGGSPAVPYDLVFATDTSLSTYLAWEVESWDAANGVLWAWVALPTVNGSGASANTTLAAAWGNASVATPQNAGSFAPAQVWSGYAGVWHLGNGSTLNLDDSTASGNGGANSGSTAVVGQIGGAAAFNGSTQFITIPSAMGATTNASVSVSFWVYPQAAGAYPMVITRDKGTGNNPWELAYGLGGNLAPYYGTNGQPTENSATTSVTLNEWNQVVYVYNSSSQTFQWYINGAAAGAGTANGNGNSTWWTANGAAYIGKRDDGYFGSNEMYLDEMEIASAARGADWVTDAFNNQHAPGDISAAGFLIWTAAR